MSKLINYNSWDESFKAPFGALSLKEEATINVITNKDFNIYNVSLVILGENEDLTTFVYDKINCINRYNIFCSSYYI